MYLLTKHAVAIVLYTIALHSIGNEKTHAASKAEQVNNAVILVYHHVSESTPSSTSVSPKVFRQHMQYLSQHHTVLPLDEIVDALKHKRTLPDKAVAITFDDGFANILHNAHPILQELNLPYTVFVCPELINTRPSQLSWAQLKQMRKAGVTIANHSLAHRHLLNKTKDQTDQQWLTAVLADIDSAQAMLQANLDTVPRFVAYPYGEYSLALSKALKQKGYVGFAQHSGAIASFSDFGALPRFAAAGIYANLRTLKTKLNSLAMPISNLQTPDPLLPSSQRRPKQSFDLEDPDIQMNALRCYLRGEVIEHYIDASEVSIDLQKPLPVGRSRINCTAPSKRKAGRYYWYSIPWFIPDERGNWRD